jgi:hypothetical protein
MRGGGGPVLMSRGEGGGWGCGGMTLELKGEGGALGQRPRPNHDRRGGTWLTFLGQDRSPVTRASLVSGTWRQ